MNNLYDENVNPLVSIILPTYNGVQYISDSIKSCLNQTYENIELLIVDDGSTNNVCEIANSFAGCDSRVKLLCHDENRKLPAALNTGFSAAKGDYFTWISDDNIYKENAIERMLDCIMSHPDADIVYADYDVVDSDLNFLRCRQVEPSEEMLIGNTIGACFLYKKEVHYKINGFDERRFLLEDWDFWIRAYKYFNFFKLPENLYIYRIHNASLTSNRKDDIVKNNVDFILEQAGSHERFTGDVKARAYLQVLEYTMLIEDEKKAKLCFEKAISISDGMPLQRREDLLAIASKVTNYHFIKSLDSQLSDGEVLAIFEDWQWLYRHYAEHSFPACSEYTALIAASIAAGRFTEALETYKNLKNIRGYTLELENARTCFLDQLTHKDTVILELENARTLFLDQLTNKNTVILELQERVCELEKMVNLRNEVREFMRQIGRGEKKWRDYIANRHELLEKTETPLRKEIIWFVEYALLKMR